MDNEYPYRARNKFQIPISGNEVVNPYDHDSRLFQDLVQRGYSPTFVQTVNLGTAGSVFLPVGGFHFVVYGHDGSATKAADTSVLVNVSINKQCDDVAPFPAKNARGFSGPFGQLFCSWPAQVNGSNPRYADIIIFKGAEQPWIDGEACT